jgi:hypothetical protein
MPIALFGEFHPLMLFSLFSLLGLLWGVQAAIGANLGQRRGLVWQTGFILGLLFSGIFIAFFYSIRPLTQQGEVQTPKWVDILGKRFPLFIAAAALGLALIMEVINLLPPVYRVSAPWEMFWWIGLVIGVVGLVAFTALGGYLGKKWYQRSM